MTTALADNSAADNLTKALADNSVADNSAADNLTTALAENSFSGKQL
jgi:hypothetical protein